MNEGEEAVSLPGILCSLKLSANALTLAAGGGPANLVGFLKGRVGIRRIQTDTGMQITLKQALWLLLGTWFIFSSKLIWKAIRKWLNGTSLAWSRACFSPGDSSGQNPSGPNSWAMPRECHEGLGAHQEAVALNGSLYVFVCFLLLLPLFSCSHWDVRVPVTPGGSPCFVSHLVLSYLERIQGSINCSD